MLISGFSYGLCMVSGNKTKLCLKYFYYIDSIALKCTNIYMNLAGSGRRKTMSSGARFLVTNFHIDMLKMLMIAPLKIHLFMAFLKILITV